jgi:hypothetical protein
VFAVAGSAAYPINRRSLMLAFPSDVHAKRVATIFVWPSICRQVQEAIVRGR